MIGFSDGRFWKAGCRFEGVRVNRIEWAEEYQDAVCKGCPSIQEGSLDDGRTKMERGE